MVTSDRCATGTRRGRGRDAGTNVALAGRPHRAARPA